MADIRSRPRYRPLALDPTGARHLLLCDQARVPDSAWEDGIAPDAPLETWTIAGDSHALPGPVSFGEAPPSHRPFRARAHMLEFLHRRLAQERMGLRLYAVGTEDFLWDVRNAGQQAGLSLQEVRLVHAGSLRRRVVCVHCRTVMEGVATNVVVCAGCHADLFVRDHFSRRYAGYQGVQVDAEVPGDVPAVEETFP